MRLGRVVRAGLRDLARRSCRPDALLRRGAVPAILWLPALTLMAIVTALGVGIFLASVNVRYRDVKYVVPFLVQLLDVRLARGSTTSTLIPTEWRGLFALIR